MMRTFSKFVTICNFCFLIMVAFTVIDMYAYHIVIEPNSVIREVLIGSMIILAIMSLLFNLLFLSIISIQHFVGKPVGVNKSVIWMDLVFLIAQVVFFLL